MTSEQYENKKAYQREYYKKNKEKADLYQKERRALDPDIKARDRERYQRNKEQRRIYQQEYNYKKRLQKTLSTQINIIGRTKTEVAEYFIGDLKSKLDQFILAGFYYNLEDGKIYSDRNKVIKSRILSIKNSKLCVTASANHFVWYYVNKEVCPTQIHHKDGDLYNINYNNLEKKVIFNNGFKKGHDNLQPISKRFKTLNYVNNATLTYELIISLGKGKLTKKAEDMIMLIGDNISRKFRYNNSDDAYDCKMHGIYQMFTNWRNFNYLKYENSFAYFTELAKRGHAKGLEILIEKKQYDQYIPRKISLTNWY